MSVVDSIFNKLKASRVASQASMWQQYDTEVVTPLADQKEIDAELCERFLKELGKVEFDLRSDLDVLNKRRGLRQKHDVGKEASSKLHAAEAKLEALDRAFNQQRQKYLAERSPLEESLRDLHQLVMQAQGCDNELFQSVRNPDLLQRISANREKLAEIRLQITPLQEQLTRNVHDGLATIRYRIAQFEDELDKLENNRSTIKKIGDALLAHTTGDRSSFDRRNRIAELKARLEPLYSRRDEMQAELNNLRDQLRNAENEQRQLRDEALVP
jgi:chromosome segregation ATPase